MSAIQEQGTSQNGDHSPRPRSRFRGLRAQIVLWTVLPVTLVLVGVAFTGVYSHEQAMQELVRERDQALAAVSAVQIQSVLRQRVEPLQELAAEQAFHHPDAEEQRNLLKLAGTLGGRFLQELVVVDESGSLLLGGGSDPVWTGDARIGELARRVMLRQDVVALPTTASLESGPALFVGVPVADEAGETYGVLAGQLSVQSLGLEALLQQVQVGEQGVAYLVDGTGQILAREPADRARHSLTGHTGLDVALQDAASGATLCLAPDGERMTLAYAPMEFGSLSWRVLVEQPWAEVVGPVLRYSQFVPLVMVLAVIVSLLALYYGVRSIVRPLQRLGQQAEGVAWGDFDATGTPVGGVQEIEELRATLTQMARRIQAYQRGMHDYIAAMTQGQEEERRRLARELHDDTVQSLIVLNHRVEKAQKLLSKDPDSAARPLAEVRVSLAAAIEGVRRFSRDLRPIYLEDLGFIPALEVLAREADGQDGPSVRFSLEGHVRRLSPDMELAAYRIVQEAINNVLKHAQATEAHVSVGFEPGYLRLTVRDNGRGFVPPDVPDLFAHRGHFGLMGMQERALLYGGRLSIDSAPGSGTDVSVRLPYSDVGDDSP